jgi:hypothetical protein
MPRVGWQKFAGRDPQDTSRGAPEGASGGAQGENQLTRRAPGVHATARRAAGAPGGRELTAARLLATMRPKIIKTNC